MSSFQSYPEASRQLSTIATGTGLVILVYGVYSLGRIFVAGVVYGGLGAVQGILISAVNEENELPKTTIDWCFDCMEHAGIFLVRKSVSMLREGFKNALSGMGHESASVIQPWCQFYKSFSPKHNKTIETTEKTPPNQPVNQNDESDLYKAYCNLP